MKRIFTLRAWRPPAYAARLAATGLHRSLGGHLRECFVDEAFEPHRPFVQVAARHRLLIALAEVFVGDVQCHQHGQAEHVAGGRRI